MKSFMPPEDITCHETGHKKKCRDLCLNCWKWIQIRGTDPQTGEDVDSWKCADAWMPILLIENSKQQMETGAAVESFRNEVVFGTATRLPAETFEKLT